MASSRTLKASALLAAGLVLAVGLALAAGPTPEATPGPAPSGVAPSPGEGQAPHPAPALASLFVPVATETGSGTEAPSDDPLHRMTRTPQGLVELRSVRPVPPVAGEPLVVRWTLWNPGEAPVELAEDPCALEYDGSLRIEEVEHDCSPGARTLAPGDSAWVEVRGRVASSPGTHEVGSLLPGIPVAVTPSGAPAPADDGIPLPPGSDPLRPPARVPVVLELGDPRLDRERVKALFQGAAGPDLVVLVAPEAARAQVETAPWLRLALEAGEGGGLEANACWHRPGDGDAGCAPLRTRIPAAPVEELLAPAGPLRRLAVTLLSLRELAP